MRYTYKCTDCGNYTRNVPIETRDDQMCYCGTPLARQLMSDARSATVAIPIYMQAGHDDLFPPGGLEPKNETERQMQRDCDARPYPKGL